MKDRDDSQMDVDRLISRVVDGEASQSEWRAFRQAAEADPLLWRELAETQQEQSELSVQVMQAVAGVEHIEAPVAEGMAYRFDQRVRAAVVVGGWSGWLAAAAAVLLIWGVGLPGTGAHTPAGQDGPVIQAGVGGGWADALQTYLDRGRESGKVVGELPERILLDARRIPSMDTVDGGQYEVLYLRQIMERAVVDELYGVGSDDAGRPAPVRIHIAPSVRTVAPLMIHVGSGRSGLR